MLVSISFSFNELERVEEVRVSEETGLQVDLSSSSVLSWNPFIALRVAGVKPRLEFPRLAAGVPVGQMLEQRDLADPEVERHAGLDEGDGQEGDGEERDSKEDGGQYHASNVCQDEEEGSDQPGKNQPP